MAQISPPEKTVLVDTFGGAGGNAIAFALSGRWKQVFYIEKDALTTKCAKHNAEIYGVKNKIIFTTGDCFDVLAKRYTGYKDKAVIFASPPWGGPGYKDDEVFNLSTMEPYNLSKLHISMTKTTPDVALYLPRTSNLNQLAKFAKDEKELQVVHYCLDGASKVKRFLLCHLSEADPHRHCARTMGTFFHWGQRSARGWDAMSRDGNERHVHSHLAKLNATLDIIEHIKYHYSLHSLRKLDHVILAHFSWFRIFELPLPQLRPQLT